LAGPMPRLVAVLNVALGLAPGPMLEAIITRMSSSSSRAEESEQRPGPHPAHLRIHAVNVFVRDQDVSLRFYVDLLGFSLVGDVRFESGERWVAVAPPDGSTVLSLVAPKPDSKEYSLIGHSVHVVLVTDDFVAKYGEWRKRGVRFQYAPRLKRLKYERRAAVGSSDGPVASEPQESLWGGAMTHFRDPDGNSFALVSYDEESRAVEAQRRAAAARLEAERRVAQELEIAKQVQTKLFPQNLPPFPTLDYSGICVQARQVGGDYYDFLELGRERLGLVIGDISGKGIAAALLMANLQANLRSQCAIASDQPHRFLQMVNRLFYENSTDNAYATLIFAEYDQPRRRLRYANCGHLSALLLRSHGDLERLHSTCTVLGMFQEWDCCTQELPLSPGDTLALYTDGVTESFNPQGEEFGEERLIESLRRHREQSSQALIGSVVNDVRKFSPAEQFDDRTLIIAKGR
jgi:serine phosphatase RsbU (regulator of sigma subunit)/catechol 2,3-dioxygenase-like lactoylglutathione lyase family enzyme